jgi:WD40 repeat protein/pimeloyl-ACP methyl ester carboxylesterase
VENNPQGLTELYSAAEPQVDFVFVHGLRGGSVKTWCDKEDLDLFWPKEWLAVDEDLRHRVRTSSFGYANDWLTSKSSQLTLHDFGRDLIYQLDNSPYLRKDQHKPIVLIGHSMGGLVIKKAFLLAHQQGKEIASRIKCIIFLATPHRGSAAAELLSNILDLVGWEKPFVEDLCRDSRALQVINDEFRHVVRSENLRLWSFYETQAMIGSTLIVKEGSAVLGYDKEEVNMVFADHRSICKFESPEDPTYLNLRNTLLRITDILTSESQMKMSQEKVEQMAALETYLNILHPPQFDLDQQCDKQIEQSCTWLERRPGFQGWLDGDAQSTTIPSESPRIRTLQRRSTLSLSGRRSVYWLTGNPGAGKSVCAAHVITRLQTQKRDCAYHFFGAGEKAKTRVSSLLLSIAFQMAEMHECIRKALTELQNARNSFDGDDDGAVWRKLFVNCILKSPIRTPQYWVIDAVDECAAADKLFQKLNALECSFDLRIFMTSRHSSRLEGLFRKLGSNISTTMDSIQSDDTEADMRLYLYSRLESLPVENAIERNAMVETLLQKANNSFLWLKLVSHELEGVYSQGSIDEVLSEVPFEMSELYERSLGFIRTLKRASERQIAKAVLIWCACAMRPLTVEELTIALNQYDGDDVSELDADSKGYKVTNLKAFIEGPCAGLLFVDGRGCVQFVHSTARDYILDPQSPKLNVARAAGNEKLARACLKCLVKELAATRNPSLGGNDAWLMRNRTVFVNYASSAFSEHVASSSSGSHQLLQDVASFLSSTALAWIENIATQQRSLHPLIRAAKNFKEFLRRRAKHEPPLGHDFSTLDGWSTDLVRLVAKFGRHLRSNPSCIHNLIPWVAPRQSRLSRAVHDGPRWLEMAGPASETWDDCVCAIQYKDSWGTCLATGENLFAIGLKNGAVIVYDQSTCQEKLSVKHTPPAEMSQSDSSFRGRPHSTVRLLAFDSSDSQFASATVHSICVWSIEGELLRTFSLQEACVSMRFSVDQDGLLGVTRSSRVVRWQLREEEDMLSVPAVYSRRLSTGDTRLPVSDLSRQAPLTAAINSDQSMVAMLYRGKPIYICSLEDGTVLGTCGRDAGSSAPNISVQTALFNPNPELSLLAVAYQDGVLAVYDALARKELVSIDGDAYSLAATPDGRTLGTGNTRGVISLWDFETLCLLCSIGSGCEEIRSLAFSGDGLRVVDIRDSSTKIWEPSALVRRSAEENASMSDAVALDAPIVAAGDEIVSITAMCPDDIGQFIYAGRDDGSVVAYGVSTGVVELHLYTHARGLFVSAITFREGMLGSVDAGGRVIVQRLPQLAGENNDYELLLSQFDVMSPVRQLLFNDDGSRLMVASAKYAAVWNVLTGQRCTEMSLQSSLSERPRQWVRLGKSVGIVTRSSLELYDWDAMGHVCMPPLPIPNSLNEPFMASSAQEVLVQGPAYDIVACAFSRADLSGTRIVGWSRSIPQHAAVELQFSTRPFFLDIPGPAIKSFIGIYSDLAIFLDEDLWVCSVKLGDEGPLPTPQVQRHFFIPSDLVRASVECRTVVTAQGNIVFAKEGELAIVKGGLSWCCP